MTLSNIEKGRWKANGTLDHPYQNFAHRIHRECLSILLNHTSLIKMHSNTPPTSPSSDGATRATIASLSSKDLSHKFNESIDTTTELSPSLKSPSITSVHPKNAFAVSAIDTPVVVSDDSGQHQRRNTMLESMMGLTKEKGTQFSFYRLIIGSMFAYVVLGIWVWTVIQFMITIDQQGCSTAYTGLTHKLSTDFLPDVGFDDASKTMSCLDMFTGTLACAHSITFGLISAVVIHETSSEDDTANSRLSSMIKPIKKRRDVNANFIQRCVCSSITSLPTIYILSWTILGLTCFVYSLTRPDGSTGPLFYTGQTWIGLVIKATYSFFGIEHDENSTSDATAEIRSGQQLKGQGRVEV